MDVKEQYPVKSSVANRGVQHLVIVLPFIKIHTVLLFLL